MKNHGGYRLLSRMYDPILGSVNAGLIRISLGMTKPAPGLRVLDVACGTGSAVAAYRAAGCVAEGIDLSLSMLEVARKKLGGETGLLHGDATKMPFDDGSFDLATITLALHEMDPDVRGKVLAECERILGPGGRLFAIDYHGGPLDGAKGILMRAATFVVERAVGGAHYRNYREFLRAGCLPELFSMNGWTVVKIKPLSGGNLAAVLASPPRS